MLSDNYNAITLGKWLEYTAGCHLFYAARSSSKLNNDTRHEGTSYQVAYNKYLVQTATRFSVAASALCFAGLQDIQRPSLRK
uniref:Fimbria/pilus outer membrane usher protein n=1 Tax=Escherichia coli TaxID=562 RepID=A0A6N0IP73_ECOLX|nr:fimbria/pilus outer membrane usher protein [Escherichia coli]